MDENAQQAVYVLKKIISYGLLVFFAAGIGLLIAVTLKVNVFIEIFFGFLIACTVVLIAAAIAIGAIVRLQKRKDNH